MAAMAPALTDAPAEAHHIRFKLAPPSSTLSPGSGENNSNASNILISSNGAVKRKALAAAAAAAGEEARSLDFRDGGREEPQPAEAPPPPPTPLGKLQPLVASYLCSDVTSVPSTKESLKLQGVLIKQSVLKTHGILPGSYFGASDYLPRKRQTLELSGEQLKSLMSAGGQPPVANGLAKKLAKTGADRDHAALVNGGRPPAGQDSAAQAPPPPPEARPSVSKGDPAGQLAPPPPRETAGTSRAAANGSEPAAYAAFAAPPGGRTDPGPRTPGGRAEGPSADGGEEEEEEGGGDGDGGLASPARDLRLLSPSGGLDSEVRDRTALSHSRQGEIEGRLRRLRKRLQVVQAKQVERHVQQQLGGFLQTTFSKLPSLDALRLRSPAVLTRKAEAALWRAASDPGAEDGLGRFLKGGSVPGELERLSLSGTASLRAAEGAFDSDATESSSGGETDVEEEELTRVDIEQRHISLWRRAEGRYALERASIVSHWNWLQAHISDLEYRIRQQTDIYRQIRTNKGSLELGDSAPCEAPAEEAPEVKTEGAACQGTQDGGSEGAERAASPRSPGAEAGLWKASGPGRPVNGMISSLRPGPPDRASSQSPDPGEQAGQKKQRLAQPLPSPPSDGTCVAARTRPVLGCRKRRLVRPAAVASLGRKVQRIPGPRCGCDVNPQCATCAGRPPAPGAEPPYEQPLLERLSQLDPSVHPILSFPDDVSMGLHFQRVMKSHWHGKPPEKTKPLKKLSLKHKLSLGGRPHDPCSPSSSKDKHKLANSLLPGLRLSHHKMRPEKLHRGHLEGRSLCKGEQRGQGLPPGAYDRGHGRKRPREHYPERTDANPKLCVDAGGPCSPLTGLHTPSHSPLVRQLSTSSEGSTPVGPGSQSATSTPQPIRRRRGESSFDINNIVIPMSVAATTRVEKLQYKEILTPSWREVDIFAKPIAEEDENVEIEDLTDTAFTQLHLPCEEQERSRWTWMASAPAKRRGSRSYKSLDGRTTPLLGGTTPSTPQPASPDAPHFHALQDYGPVPSPRSPASPDLPPATPRACSEDTRCSTPDFTAEELVPQTVQPWERRDFPLEEDPALEPAAEQGGPEGEGPGRGARRASGSRAAPGCRTESESGPASPLPPASAQQ
ncbi:KAT8 regulatory NSL complex subunit 1-like isoform X1 [Anguilla anguilla]|uniref:KAT8 regulatory NSL complex subunit 1-like isoform X1 n=1 Tax=Anguilla anguilla TaxID=7936 RepID=UPI0015AC3774|nr:KAT8 regulatory NSL complex subunit 1-like isoform X1 [Anguilla anguilla]XP_035262097.1 KAT8 regulatory NSL complex subunit 1-like isoform X1 [Anguilla anguilla]XP_035262098.1 KAT8 regulatory NSL complex subunit 1-like isoform X1 [Anguilla anguilla]